MSPAPDPAFVDFLRAAAGDAEVRLRRLLEELAGLSAVTGGEEGDEVGGGGRLAEFLVGQIRRAGAEAVRAAPIDAAASRVEGVPSETRPAAVAILARLPAVAGDPSGRPAVIQAVDVRQPACLAVALTQLHLFGEFRQRTGRLPAGACLYCFEGLRSEEVPVTAGGAEALAVAGVPALVCAPTGLVPVMAGAGIMPFFCRLTASDRPQTALELFPLVALELEKLAMRLGEEAGGGESAARAIVCHLGVLGGYGLSGDAAAERVEIDLAARTRANPDRVAMKLIEFLDEAVGAYTRLHGDATRPTPPRNGGGGLRHHFDVKVETTAAEQRFRVIFHGLPGPMGPRGSCDSAVTKAAYMLAALLKASAAFPNVQASARLSDGSGDAGRIILGGVESFVPPLSTADLQRRMTAAVEKGVQKLCRVRRLRPDPRMAELVFGESCPPWSSPPTSLPGAAFEAAAGLLGLQLPADARSGAGFPPAVSAVAARLAHLGCPVTVFGPAAALPPRNRQEDVKELCRAALLAAMVAGLCTDAGDEPPRSRHDAGNAGKSGFPAPPCND